MSNVMLEVRELTTNWVTRFKEDICAVDHVSLKVEEGKSLGIAGESGCGKSTLALSLMGYYFPPLHYMSGEIIIAGRNVSRMDPDEVRKSILGKEIAYIPQSAMNALNPTQKIIHLGNKARRSEHGCASTVGMHGSATTFTAVTDGVEAVEHGILEEGVMDVTAFILRLQDGDGFVARDPAGAIGLMFADETGERIANYEADIHGQAGILASGTTGTIDCDDVVGILHNDGTGAFVRDDLFEIGNLNLFVDCHELFGGFEWNGFAMISVSHAGFGFSRLGRFHFFEQFVEPAEKRREPFCQGMFAHADLNVKISPASIHVSV